MLDLLRALTTYKVLTPIEQYRTVVLVQHTYELCKLEEKARGKWCGKMYNNGIKCTFVRERIGI